VRPDFLPLSRPSIGPQEIEEVTACLRSGWLTSGPRVTRFEEAFAETVGVAHAVAMSSATAGLHLALLAAGVGPGDEVVTTPMTWASTGNMIFAVGARPVFVDIDSGTLNIDPEAVARAITPRTRALLPVHFAGQPVDLDRLRAIAADHGLALIEDAAHALGTTYRGRPIGGGSAAAVFSFHPIKAITTGEGGMVATDDAALADRLRLLRFHGIARDAWSRYGRRGNPGYDIVALGFKYNMTDLQAALGLAQLARLQEFVEARTRIAAWYREALAQVPAVEMLAPVSYPARHAWHLLVVRLRLEALRLGRDEVMDGLLAANIGVGLHFKALHLHRLYREQLARLEEFIEARTRIASWYAEALRSIPGVEMLEPVRYPARHAWHLLVVRLQLEVIGIGRDAVMEELLAANIGVGLHFKALHLHRLYREQLALGPDALPHATSASERILSLPLFPGMTREDVKDAAGALEEILRRHAA